MSRPVNVAQLLAPLTLDEFVARYWQAEPCHIPGEGTRFNGIISIAELEDHIMIAAPPRSTVRTENRHSSPGFASDAYAKYACGDTVIFDYVEAWHGEVNALCHEAEEIFNAVVGATAYISPARSQAVGPHYHPYDSFVLQVAGERQWEIWAPYSRFPLSGDVVVDPGMLQDPVLSPRVKSGDLLYIPRGYPHCAFTRKNPALHLSIAVRPFTVLDLVLAGLRAAAGSDESLRKALPVGFMKASHVPADDGQMWLDQWIHTQAGIGLEDARDALASELWRLQPTFLRGRFASLHNAEQISDGTLVERIAGRLFRVVEMSGRVTLRFGETKVSAPRAAAPALRFVRDSRRFRVADLPGLEATSRLLLARRLVEVGLLSIVTEREAPQASHTPTG